MSDPMGINGMYGEDYLGTGSGDSDDDADLEAELAQLMASAGGARQQAAATAQSAPKPPTHDLSHVETPGGSVSRAPDDRTSPTAGASAVAKALAATESLLADDDADEDYVSDTGIDDDSDLEAELSLLTATDARVQPSVSALQAEMQRVKEEGRRVKASRPGDRAALLQLGKRYKELEQQLEEARAREGGNSTRGTRHPGRSVAAAEGPVGHMEPPVPPRNADDIKAEMEEILHKGKRVKAERPGDKAALLSLMKRYRTLQAELNARIGSSGDTSAPRTTQAPRPAAGDSLIGVQTLSAADALEAAERALDEDESSEHDDAASPGLSDDASLDAELAALESGDSSVRSRSVEEIERDLTAVVDAGRKLKAERPDDRSALAAQFARYKRLQGELAAARLHERSEPSEHGTRESPEGDTGSIGLASASASSSAVATGEPSVHAPTVDSAPKERSAGVPTAAGGAGQHPSASPSTIGVATTASSSTAPSESDVELLGAAAVRSTTASAIQQLKKEALELKRAGHNKEAVAKALQIRQLQAAAGLGSADDARSAQIAAMISTVQQQVEFESKRISVTRDEAQRRRHQQRWARSKADLERLQRALTTPGSGVPAHQIVDVHDVEEVVNADVADNEVEISIEHGHAIQPRDIVCFISFEVGFGPEQGTAAGETTPVQASGGEVDFGYVKKFPIQRPGGGRTRTMSRFLSRNPAQLRLMRVSSGGLFGMFKKHECEGTASISIEPLAATRELTTVVDFSKEAASRRRRRGEQTVGRVEVRIRLRAPLLAAPKRATVSRRFLVLDSADVSGGGSLTSTTRGTKLSSERRPVPTTSAATMLPRDVALEVCDPKRIRNHAALTKEIEYLVGLQKQGLDKDPTSSAELALAISLAQQFQHSIETALGNKQVSLAVYYKATENYMTDEKRLMEQLRARGCRRECARLLPRLKAALEDLRAYRASLGSS